jgi:hypothetical protein
VTQTNDDCTCLTCALRRTLVAHYPDGIDQAAGIEIATVLAAIAGTLLAAHCEEDMQAFVTLLVAERRIARRNNPQHVGGLH